MGSVTHDAAELTTGSEGSNDEDVFLVAHNDVSRPFASTPSGVYGVVRTKTPGVTAAGGVR